MPSPKAPPPIYRLKITLIGVEPPIWRRIQVPSSIKLCCLHTALQVVMGWADSHLHRFEKGGKYWGVPDGDLIDESKMLLSKLLKAEGESMVYVYDFGDDWVHEVVLEKIIAVNDVAKKPICLGGERRCPPEDVGGVSGYERFLKVIFDPKHKEYEDLAGWAGGHFIDEFDLKAVNEIFSLMRLPIRHKR
jgi:hypothetical protein